MHLARFSLTYNVRKLDKNLINIYVRCRQGDLSLYDVHDYWNLSGLKFSNTNPQFIKICICKTSREDVFEFLKFNVLLFLL